MTTNAFFFTPAVEAPIGAIATATSPGFNRAFIMAIDKEHACRVHLVDIVRGSEAEWHVVWTRDFGTLEDRDAVLSQARAGALDLVFVGRAVTIFGTAELDVIVDHIVAEAEEERAAARQEAADEARLDRSVNLYARKTKHGLHILELQRESRDKADWLVRYDRAAERDRLCDWLRWQKPRFLDFLDFAAENGSEALTRMLIDEMFVAERRIKQEGRGAGGLRPLRMWRGD
jgi:hypothetical protein